MEKSYLWIPGLNRDVFLPAIILLVGLGISFFMLTPLLLRNRAGQPQFSGDSNDDPNAQ